MWFHVWSRGAKNHFVHMSLLEGLTKDLKDRGHEVYEVKETNEAWFDLPGMIMRGRSYEKFTLDGVEFSVAAENFSYMFMKLRDAPERVFADGKKYYKIHGWLHCPVFTPEQRSVVLNYMEGEMARVEAVSDAEHEEFVKAIDHINGDVKVVADRSVIPVPVVLLSGKPNNYKN